MKKASIFFVLSAALLGIALAAKTSYYAGAVGYSWAYDNKQERVISRSQGGLLVMDNKAGGVIASSDLMRFSPQGVFLEGVMVQKTVYRYKPALRYFPAPPLYVGQNWVSQGDLAGTTYTLQGQVLAVSGIKVPAGKFNAFQIRLTTTPGAGQPSAMDLYYVPGLGIARLVTADGSKIDLVKFTIPK